MNKYIIAWRCEDDEWEHIEAESIKAWDELEALENCSVYSEVLGDEGSLPIFNSYSELIQFFIKEYKISLIVEEIY